MKYYLGIDVGGSSIKYALISEFGDVSNQNKRATPTTIESFYTEILSIYQEIQIKQEVMGIALSMPGAVDSETGIISGSSALDYIHGPNIKENLEQQINKRVEIENDANCAALAEVWIGSAKDVNDCLFIVSGTGIGGAVVKDRKIHKGKHLHGGEFGYMIVKSDIDNEEFRTWSDDGSTVACLKAIAKELNIDYHTLDGKAVFDNLDNNPVYTKYVNRFYYILAMGIYNLQYIIDPEKIVIGGAISVRDDLLEQIQKRLESIFNKLTHAKVRPVVVKCQFQNDANMIGAVYHFMQR